MIDLNKVIMVNNNLQYLSQKNHMDVFLFVSQTLFFKPFTPLKQYTKIAVDIALNQQLNTLAFIP